MSDQGAASVIVLLADVLDATLAMGGLGKRPGHMPGCQQGIWAGKFVPPAYPNGSPCSKRCQEAKQALALARTWRKAAA